MDRSQWLSEISTAIADGEPVDWAALDSQTLSPRDRELVDRLRVLEQIARTRTSVSVSLPSLHEGDTTAGGHDTFAAGSNGELATWGALTDLEKIGSGAFGDVYRAYDPRLDRTVALKLLRRRERNADALESKVIEEGRLLARVHHPNVVTVYGAERIDGRVGLWMEFIDGRTLEDEINQQGPRKPAEVLRIGLDLCGALEAVHRAGVLHLDLKAQNVMRMPTGRIVLTDFGVARDTLHRGLDERFELAGTPLYIAPELLEGQPPSVRSEVYSLGVLLFHLASGSFPLHARTLRDLRAAHVKEARVRLNDARPDLPVGIAGVIERATNPDPSRRYQTVLQLERALRRLLSARVFASRKWWILATALLGAGAGFLISFAVPARYRSQATMLVVPQQVSPDVVGRTRTTPIAERVASIHAQLLSRTRLERMIGDLNLYERERKGGIKMEDIIARMRQDVTVDPGAQNRTPPSPDTFTVGFVYSDPTTAMKVTDRLATVFIEEGLNDRSRLADGTSEFLETELDSARRKLEDCEERLTQRSKGGNKPPRVLVLDCDSIADGYKILFAKKRDASISANLERRQIGEQFTLLDRARMPERSISPNRLQISGIGVLGGIVVGILIAIPSSLRAFRRPKRLAAA